MQDNLAQLLIKPAVLWLGFVATLLCTPTKMALVVYGLLLTIAGWLTWLVRRIRG